MFDILKKTPLFYIKKSIFLYLKMFFFISRNLANLYISKIDFVFMSRNVFLDIKNRFSDIKEFSVNSKTAPYRNSSF